MNRDPLEDVEDEMAQQAAIDASDADPPTKLAARDAARGELEDEQGTAPDPGPNPS